MFGLLIVGLLYLMWFIFVWFVVSLLYGRWLLFCACSLGTGGGLLFPFLLWYLFGGAVVYLLGLGIVVFGCCLLWQLDFRARFFWCAFCVWVIFTMLLFG